MVDAPLHIHFESRRAANPVFQITQERVDAALARRPDLAGQLKVTVGWDLEQFDDAMRTAHMLVGFMFPRERLREGAPQLRAIQMTGAGLESVRPFDWVPPQVALLNNSGVHGQKAAEFVLMAVLMLNNRMPALVNAQARRAWRPLYTGKLEGKTLLVVGVGQLGGAGAEACRRMGMQVVGVRRSGEPHPACDRVVGPGELHAELARADFVLLTVPATPETERLMGAREFAAMKPGAGFINFARGRAVDHDALVSALRSGHLSGAMLDVFDPEPLPADSPLWDEPNLLITPHCTSDDVDLYIPLTLDLALDNASRLLQGQPLRNVVDLQLGY